MAEVDASKKNISIMSEEVLMRGPLGDCNAFSLLPEHAETIHQFPGETLINQLISTVYTGPTIRDVEAALGIGYGVSCEDLGGHGSPRATISLTEKGFNKIDSKYTIRMKCCANGMADDGYKWRKYGQKLIKNSPYPRSYYRCTNSRCNAKKQVERSAEDPATLVVTYEGLHLHYAYNHFLLPQPRDASVTASTAPAVKRAKVAERAAPQASTADSPRMGHSTSTGLTAAWRGVAEVGGQGRWQEMGAAGGGCPQVQLEEGDVESSQGLVEDPVVQTTSRGLLEDIVPLLFRQPSSDDSSILSDEPSLFSAPSSPPSTSLSPFSWPHGSALISESSMFSLPCSPLSSPSSPFSWPQDASNFSDLGLLSGSV